MRKESSIFSDLFDDARSIMEKKRGLIMEQ